MAKLTLKELGKILAVSFSEFQRNEPLRLAGATAFFTTFALPPILIILVQIIGTVFRIENLREKFFVQLAGIVGKQGAAQVKVSFSGFTSLAENRMITAAGFIFLMFIATTLFKVIKDSLNQLWNVKIATDKPFKAKVEKRAVSMVVIILTGILLIGGMVAEGLESLLFHYTDTELTKQTASFLRTIINQAISVIIVTVWFAILFKVLPDAKASWKVVFSGALFTGILFTAGKIIIRYMLSLGNLTSIFGASSSLALLLLFVFYSSFILYFGACFTKVFATFIKDPIKAGDYSIKYRMVETKSVE
jgi:membrane protein